MNTIETTNRCIKIVKPGVGDARRNLGPEAERRERLVNDQ